MIHSRIVKVEISDCGMWILSANNGLALSAEMRLATSHIAFPVRMEPLASAQSDAIAVARIRKLHVPVNSQVSQ
jgi:hypothetical protein